MQRYKQERIKQERAGKAAGVVLAVSLHAVVAIYGAFTGLKYIWPPPQETSFLIDFSEQEPVKVLESRTGRQPQAEDIDRTRPVDLVQQSEAQEKGTKANLAREATGDDFGDVEKYEPPREKPIDNRALFHAAANPADKDTLAAQTAREVSDALKTGHASGNTKTGKSDGEPNAHLKGRTVLGTLPKPNYASTGEGLVVVQIWVDQYGNVQKAIPGYEGTTLVDSKIWAAVRKAAMEAHFNMSGDAPVMQEGTITYKFKLTN